MFDFNKLCRACMEIGTRNIFQKTDQFSNNSSLSRLVEKLRYVSMIMIKEDENMPYLLCDACIFELNISYNFKQKFIGSDTKLRQYAIENGLPTMQNNPRNMTFHPLLQQNQEPVVTNHVPEFQHRPFISVPVQIKTEQADYTISNIPLDRNIEMDDGSYSTQANYNPDIALLNQENNCLQMLQLHKNLTSDSNYARPSSLVGEPLTILHNSNNHLMSEPTLIVANKKVPIKKKPQNQLKLLNIEEEKPQMTRHKRPKVIERKRRESTIFKNHRKSIDKSDSMLQLTEYIPQPIYALRSRSKVKNKRKKTKEPKRKSTDNIKPKLEISTK